MGIKPAPRPREKTTTEKLVERLGVCRCDDPGVEVFDPAPAIPVVRCKGCGKLVAIEVDGRYVAPLYAAEASSKAAREQLRWERRERERARRYYAKKAKPGKVPPPPDQPAPPPPYEAPRDDVFAAFAECWTALVEAFDDFFGAMLDLLPGDSDAPPTESTGPW